MDYVSGVVTAIVHVGISLILSITIATWWVSEYKEDCEKYTKISFGDQVYSCTLIKNVGE